MRHENRPAKAIFTNFLSLALRPARTRRGPHRHRQDRNLAILEGFSSRQPRFSPPMSKAISPGSRSPVEAHFVPRAKDIGIAYAATRMRPGSIRRIVGHGGFLERRREARIRGAPCITIMKQM